MDWSKAKSILIMIFIVLNIFLITFIGIYSSQNNISKGTITSTISILEKKGVKINTDYIFPKHYTKTPMLIIENTALNIKPIIEFLLNEDYDVEENVDSQSSEKGVEKNYRDGNKTIDFIGNGTFVYNDSDCSIRISNDTPMSWFKDPKKHKQAHKVFREFFANMDINVSRFTLDNVIAAENGRYTFIFIEEYNKYLVFDNSIMVTVLNEGIESIYFNINKVIGFEDDSSSIMPAHQILLKNYYGRNNDYYEDIIIKSIAIGFKAFNGIDEDKTGNDNDTKEIVQGPAWRIILGDESKMYFKAYDGEKIK